MPRRAVLASLFIVGACRHSLEDAPDARVVPDAPMIDAGPSPSCIEAQSHSDLAFIEDQIFRISCIASSCHDGQGPGAGTLNLKKDFSHDALVGVDAETDSEASPAGSYKLVVAGQPRQSYLMFMIRHYSGTEMDPPAGAPNPNVGFMPQDISGQLPPLCIEKREAIVRWIEAGAPARVSGT